ncbi:uncharacterized protein L203_102863 [Cryptococcus depauperatus CBS 7841]|uniref:Uncharacterized protein n=1 Tax=Cryptococcus depauperatus CBS 7841 TaxID=1295531 RepID=A0A1E3IAY2_9TREE|nr:hypothetical protein L203_04667 [Cryptococcus depauperatus CBS 7841]
MRFLTEDFYNDLESDGCNYGSQPSKRSASHGEIEKDADHSASHSIRRFGCSLRSYRNPSGQTINNSEEIEHTIGHEALIKKNSNKDPKASSPLQVKRGRGRPRKLPPTDTIKTSAIERQCKGSSIKTSTGREGRRAGEACTHCRGRKQKCTEGRPCSLCIKEKKECIYESQLTPAERESFLREKKKGGPAVFRSEALQARRALKNAHPNTHLNGKAKRRTRNIISPSPSPMSLSDDMSDHTSVRTTTSPVLKSSSLRRSSGQSSQAETEILLTPKTVFHKHFGPLEDRATGKKKERRQTEQYEQEYMQICKEPDEAHFPFGSTSKIIKPTEQSTADTTPPRGTTSASCKPHAVETRRDVGYYRFNAFLSSGSILELDSTTSEATAVALSDFKWFNDLHS